MRCIYRNKKTNDYLDIYKCDYCGKRITKLDEKQFERICTFSEGMERMCGKCGDAISKKND
jgi:hypothetical protein